MGIATLNPPYARFRPTLPDLVRKVGAETIDPEADAFVANIDPTFVKQVFHISQRQRKSDVHHHTKLDDLGRGLEVAERVLAISLFLKIRRHSQWQYPRYQFIRNQSPLNLSFTIAILSAPIPFEESTGCWPFEKLSFNASSVAKTSI